MTEPRDFTDPFSKVKDDVRQPWPTPRQVNEFHRNADTDAGPGSIHHSLGIKHNQACCGDHNHDGKSSRKIGANMGLAVTGSKAGNAALASLLTALAQVIEFADTTT